MKTLLVSAAALVALLALVVVPLPLEIAVSLLFAAGFAATAVGDYAHALRTRATVATRANPAGGAARPAGRFGLAA